jgi:hypothetical protein
MNTRYSTVYETDCKQKTLANMSALVRSILQVLQSSASMMSEPTEVFTHTALDLKSAKTIRLIEVVPSRDGGHTIECKLTHATTDSRYVCLSYVWGTDEATYPIYINGLLFRVRSNLWAFLQNASLRLSRNQLSSSPEGHDHSNADWTTQSMWIDAVCIDQENTLERNHQVQQMGRIHGNSQRVIVWFGENSRGASLLEQLRMGADLRKRHDSQLLMRRFCDDVYWERAWTTQEVLLAHDLTFLAGTNEAELLEMKVALGESLKSFGAGDAYRHFQPFYDILEREERYTLLENIWRFRHKMCPDRRDIIYSLLSISHISRDLDVDYSISSADLALRVLHVLGPDLCLCSAKVLHRVLNYLDAPWMKRDYTFATLDLTPPTSILGEVCPSCYEATQDEHIHQLSFRTFEVRIYCLGCIHKGSSMRPEYRALFRRAPRVFRHGHIILTRHSPLKSTPLWRVHWLHSLTGLNKLNKQIIHGPLRGVQVVRMDDDGATSVHISSKDFALWASPSFKAELFPRENIIRDESMTESDHNNPRWTLLSQKT